MGGRLGVPTSSESRGIGIPATSNRGLYLAAASGLFATGGAELLPLGGEVLSSPGIVVSLFARMAVAVEVELIAAAMVLNVRGLEDRRRQLLEDSLRGCMGEGVRFLKAEMGVNERFFGVIPSILEVEPEWSCNIVLSG